TWFGTEPLDWGSLFERWAPAQLIHGESTRTLSAGGIMAHEVARKVTVSVTGSDAAALYLVHDSGTGVTVQPIAGHTVDIGNVKRGARVYAVVVRPVAGSERTTLSVTAKKPPAASPAQAPVTGSVVTLAPGVGVRVGGITSQYVQFEVPEDVDNARAEVRATNTLPGDVDLYMQQRNAAGTWTAVPGAEGESSSTTGESMDVGRLEAGTYRIEVHNWAGPPGNQVNVRTTFFNSAGEAGA
ncbi:MAG TPA: hypothetical protein VG709_00200, partial [Actinomycetota bacterium]|nr:hypothetical protein [Actinomycetota bacterium]